MHLDICEPGPYIHIYLSGPKVSLRIHTLLASEIEQGNQPRPNPPSHKLLTTTMKSKACSKPRVNPLQRALEHIHRIRRNVGSKLLSMLVPFVSVSRAVWCKHLLRARKGKGIYSVACDCKLHSLYLRPSALLQDPRPFQKSIVKRFVLSNSSWVQVRVFFCI